jgi:hypothetical protein
MHNPPIRRRWPKIVALVLALLLASGGAAYAFGLFDAMRPTPGPPPAVTGDPDGGNAGVQAHLVQREDNRIRAALRTGVRAPSLKPIATKGSLPTLVLIKRPAPYTAVDLVRAGVLQVSGGVGLLTTNVFVGPGAVLSIDGRQLQTLRLTSSPAGYATLVTWGGSLRLGNGLTVTSWDPAKQAPDAVFYDGRAYIRANTGNLRIDGVMLNALGYWSGRTGGISWTGDDTGNSTGSVTNSTITGDQYGLFLSRSADVKLDHIKVVKSIRDGIRIHRAAMRTLITASEVSAGGGDGIVVSRGSASTVLRGVTSTANTGTGLVLDGRSLASSDTVSGAATTPTEGTLVDGAVIADNHGVSVRVHGGVGTTLRRVTVRGTDRGIVVQDHAKAVSVEHSTVSGSGSAGLVLDGDDHSVVTDSTFSGWRTGIQLRDSARPVLRRDNVVAATLFGLSLRGRVTNTVVDHCTLAGRGPRAVDVRTLTPDTNGPVLTSTSTVGWVVAVAPKSFRQLVEEHPALWTWTLILLAPPLLWWRARARAKLRPGQVHPYRETTKWSPHEAVLDGVAEIRFDGFPSLHAPQAAPPLAAPQQAPPAAPAAIPAARAAPAATYRQPAAPQPRQPVRPPAAARPPVVQRPPAGPGRQGGVSAAAAPRQTAPGRMRFTAPTQPATVRQTPAAPAPSRAAAKNPPRATGRASVAPREPAGARTGRCAPAGRQRKAQARGQVRGTRKLATVLTGLSTRERSSC